MNEGVQGIIGEVDFTTGDPPPHPANKTARGVANPLLFLRNGSPIRCAWAR